MAALTLIRENPKGYMPRVDITSAGMRVVDHYAMDSGNPADLPAATGGPSIGAAHPDAKLSSAVCTGWGVLRVESAGEASSYTNPTTYGANGRTIVQATFETPGWSAEPEIGASAGDAFHELLPRARSQTIYHAVNGDQIPPTAVEAQEFELVVYSYVNAATYVARLTDYLSVARKTNTGSVSIPAMKGVSGSGFTAAAGELRGRPQVRIRNVQDGLVEVALPFAFAPDHKLRWRETDETGDAVGAVLEATVYEGIAYPTLW